MATDYLKIIQFNLVIIENLELLYNLIAMRYSLLNSTFIIIEMNVRHINHR